MVHREEEEGITGLSNVFFSLHKMCIRDIHYGYGNNVCGCTCACAFGGVKDSVLGFVETLSQSHAGHRMTQVVTINCPTLFGTAPFYTC